ncbi:hypothetical protein ACXDF8_16580 [Mycolicibacterium sp. CBM1]
MTDEVWTELVTWLSVSAADALAAAEACTRLTDARELLPAPVFPVARAGPAVAAADGRDALGRWLPVDFADALVEALLEVAEPEPAEPVASADAVAGVAASAAPIPRAIADAPTQVASRTRPEGLTRRSDMPPNSAGSERNSITVTGESLGREPCADMRTEPIA